MVVETTHIIQHSRRVNLLLRHARRFSPEVLREHELKHGNTLLMTQATKPMRSFPRASNTLTKPAIHTIQRHAPADTTKLDRAWLVLGYETCNDRLQDRGGLPVLLDTSKKPGDDSQLLV
eukprot:1785586-Pyramimonas_sp.AAC.1